LIERKGRQPQFIEQTVSLFSPPDSTLAQTARCSIFHLSVEPRSPFRNEHEDEIRNKPVELIVKLTVSMTSTKASFFLYFTSERRQLVFPVAWMVILLLSSLYSIETAEEYENDAITRTRQKEVSSRSRDWARQRAGGTNDGEVRLDAFGGDVHLEGVDFGVLRVAKVEDLYIITNESSTDRQLDELPSFVVREQPPSASRVPLPSEPGPNEKRGIDRRATRR
jgi:hypothetical protein